MLFSWKSEDWLPFLRVADLLYDLRVLSRYVCFTCFLDGDLFSRGNAFYFCARSGLKLLGGEIAAG